MNEKVLENWSLQAVGRAYDAPETYQAILVGDIDGKTVNTSRITEIVEDGVYTRNSFYELGEVDPEYEKEFPNARQRIRDMAREV